MYKVHTSRTVWQISHEEGDCPANYSMWPHTAHFCMERIHYFSFIHTTVWTILPSLHVRKCVASTVWPSKQLTKALDYHLWSNEMGKGLSRLLEACWNALMRIGILYRCEHSAHMWLTCCSYCYCIGKLIFLWFLAQTSYRWKVLCLLSSKHIDITVLLNGDVSWCVQYM